MASLALSSWKDWVFKTSKQHLDISLNNNDQTTTANKQTQTNQKLTTKPNQTKRNYPYSRWIPAGEKSEISSSDALCTSTCGAVVEVVKFSVTYPAKVCCNTSSTRNKKKQESSCSWIKRLKAITALQNLWCWFSIQGIHYLALTTTFSIFLRAAATIALFTIHLVHSL